MCEGKAILISGISGSGKSDLTLRYLWHFAPHLLTTISKPPIEDMPSPVDPIAQQGSQFGFISDDRVRLERVKTKIIAHAPQTISGLLEVRGIGIVKVAVCPPAPVSVIIRLSRPSEVSRYVDEALLHENLLGLNIPVIALNPFEQSAPLKMKLALALYGL